MIYDFHYDGPLVLMGPRHEVAIHARLWTETEWVCVGEDPAGAPVSVPGLCSWKGVARVPGLVYRLLDVLGTEVTVRLPDGRTGKAFATGWSEDSVWVVEIQGCGPPPE